MLLIGDNTLKLLSWNIQWGRGIDGQVDLARIVDTIRRIDDFDVICLQEVAIRFPGLAGSCGEDQMAELASCLQGYTPIYGVATDVPDGSGGRSQFGNAIFTKLPVGQVWRHLLPWAAELSTPSMQRMLLEAVIITQFGPVRIMTTHLEYYSQHQRNMQIQAIRDRHVEACAMSQRLYLNEECGGTFEVFPRPETAILCGDMNFPATAPERERILAPFETGIPRFQDAWSVLHPDQPHIATVGIHPVDFVDQPACFDFIFITENLAQQLKSFNCDTMTEASDHQPVWVEFE